MRSVKVKGMKKLIVALVAAFLFAVPNANNLFAAEVNNWTDFESNITGGNNVELNGSFSAPSSPPIPTVTGNVTVNGGTGDQRQTVTGYSDSTTGATANGPIIQVNQGGNLTVEGGRYTGGYGPNGGAINNIGTTTIRNSEFSNSNAAIRDITGTNEGNGGAIYNAANATLDIDNTAFNQNGQFTYNNGTETTVTTNSGGAIYNAADGIMNIGINSDKENMTFTSNVATQGGAIYNAGNATIANAKFTENKAIEETEEGSGRGGAIFNYTDAEMSITNSEFADNSAIDRGGAIHNEGTLTKIDSSTFTGNTSGNAGGAISNQTGLGSEAEGSTATASITNSTFSQNQSGSGGAIYNATNDNAHYPSHANLSIENTTFEANTATGDGGAVYNRGNGSAVITNGIFTNNTAAGDGGAIYNGLRATGEYATPNTVTIAGEKTEFTGNYAKNGGAVANYDTLNINAGEFTKNGYNTNNASVTENGGAIYNGTSDASNSVATIAPGVSFKNNVASNGGAIYNISQDDKNLAQITVNTATFENNGILIKEDDGTVLASSQKGGAIYNGGTTNSVLTVQNQSTFTGNYAQEGGAIYNAGNATITDNTFTGNGKYTDSDGNVQRAQSGGAIYVGKSTEGANRTTIERNTFDSNAAEMGGAIYNNGGTDANFVAINYNTFKNNTADQGGAIYTQGTTDSTSTVLTINGNRFENNFADSDGGAIYNNGTMSIKESAFLNNGVNGDKATEKGGAIYNEGIINITDTSFSGNKAGKGGALYGETESISNLFAENTDVYIGSSEHPELDTIYLESGTRNYPAATLNLNAMSDKNIYLNSTVTGQTGVTSLANVNINPDEKYTGNVIVNADITKTNLTLNRGMLQFLRDEYLTQSNTLNLNGGTLNMLNGYVNPIGAGKINVMDDTKLLLDVDLKNQTMDSILSSNSDVTYTGGHLDIIGLNAITDTTQKNVDILFTDVEEIAGNGVVRSEPDMLVKGPLYDYIVNQQFKTVNGVEGEYFSFNATGFDPSTNIPGVAAQLGGYLMMDNIYRQAFSNMDMLMTMTRAERQALKSRNKYASADKRAVWAPAVIPEERDGFWFRPFSNFESVSLKNGPKVSNIFYGTLIGADSDIIYLGKGWDATFSVYGAYTGSHQAFQGNDIWQNGGVLGASGILYKGNFFTGLTYNAGGSGVEATSMFGRENFGMFMTGVAWKSGYNFGFADDKFIIQPSYMMSYTFVNSSDYTNGAGLKITSDPLHAIEIIPGIKLIANLKNGWQPYFGVNMVWNIIDDTHFFAQDIALPQLSVKPYIEYGPGIQKRYGDRFTGFGQAMIRNGGRNGIAFTLGARWAIGD